MDKFQDGLDLFAKYNVDFAYDFILPYGDAHATILPTWEEREEKYESHHPKNPQSDIRIFIDGEIMEEDQKRIFQYISDIIDRTPLESELRKKNMWFSYHVTIHGTPSIPVKFTSIFEGYVDFR